MASIPAIAAGSVAGSVTSPIRVSRLRALRLGQAPRDDRRGVLVPHQPDDPMSRIDERRHDVAADEPRCAGDEDGGHGVLSACSPE